jgi:hypothetical protein
VPRLVRLRLRLLLRLLHLLLLLLLPPLPLLPLLLLLPVKVPYVLISIYDRRG